MRLGEEGRWSLDQQPLRGYLRGVTCMVAWIHIAPEKHTITATRKPAWKGDILANNYVYTYNNYVYVYVLYKWSIPEDLYVAIYIRMDLCRYGPQQKSQDWGQIYIPDFLGKWQWWGQTRIFFPTQQQTTICTFPWRLHSMAVVNSSSSKKTVLKIHHVAYNINNVHHHYTYVKKSVTPTNLKIAHVGGMNTFLLYILVGLQYPLIDCNLLLESCQVLWQQLKGWKTAREPG